MSFHPYKDGSRPAKSPFASSASTTGKVSMPRHAPKPSPNLGALVFGSSDPAQRTPNASSVSTTGNVSTPVQAPRPSSSLGPSIGFNFSAPTSSTNSDGRNNPGPFRAKAMDSESQTRREMTILRGGAIEIIVGASGQQNAQVAKWFLPKELVSRYSAFLKTACECKSEDEDKSLISLPDFEPKVFDLFVEWMYYGSYLNPKSKQIHASAWALGEKLQAKEFKNYAMGCLYTCPNVTSFNPSPMTVFTTEHVRFACKNSMPGSLLRQFFFDTVTTHFTDSNLVRGSDKEWDEVFMEHPDARASFVRGMRMKQSERNFIKPLEHYLELDKPDAT